MVLPSARTFATCKSLGHSLQIPFGGGGNGILFVSSAAPTPDALVLSWTRGGLGASGLRCINFICFILLLFYFSLQSCVNKPLYLGLFVLVMRIAKAV